jgi:hypothetical protein
MLDGGDGDAVDVADGAVADTQAGEDAQADVASLIFTSAVTLRVTTDIIANKSTFLFIVVSRYYVNCLLYKYLPSVDDVQSLPQGTESLALQVVYGIFYL